MNYASRCESGAVAMKSMGEGFEHACCVAATGVALVALSVTPSFAGTMGVPAPLIGITGPYGVLAAGVAYGGFLLFNRLKSRS
jgi:hypothetical protein